MLCTFCTLFGQLITWQQYANYFQALNQTIRSLSATKFLIKAITLLWPLTYVFVMISCDSAICFNFVNPSFSRRVPLSKANSRNCCFRKSFWPSGTCKPIREIVKPLYIGEPTANLPFPPKKYGMKQASFQIHTKFRQCSHQFLLWWLFWWPPLLFWRILWWWLWRRRAKVRLLRVKADHLFVRSYLKERGGEEEEEGDRAEVKFSSKWFLSGPKSFSFSKTVRTCPKPWIFIVQSNIFLSNFLTFFDGSLSSNDDFGSGVFLHGLEGVTARTDQQTDKVDFWVFILGNHHFVVDSKHIIAWVRRVDKLIHVYM